MEYKRLQNKRVSTPRGNRCQPKRLLIFKKSKYIKHWLILHPWINPIILFNYAAVLLQKRWRGYLRRLLIGKFPRRIKKNKENNKTRKLKLKNNNNNINSQLDKYLTYIDGFMHTNVSKPIWLQGGFSAWCAVRIQSWWRMIPFRRRQIYKKTTFCHVSALVIQTAWRNIMYKQEQIQLLNISNKRESVKYKNYGALAIQLCWRSFCNKRVFRYFKNLILNNLKGAPADILKVIVPRESFLLDRASGVHVRFRLGGSVFPPKILFKIFTHRPLCDVNSFAPRDYSKERPLDGSYLHNKSAVMATQKISKNTTMRVGGSYFGAVISSNSEIEKDWYKRDERNEWRPISSTICYDISTPPWEKFVKKPHMFNFSSQKRKDEIALEKKKKKREWMIKAYMIAQNKETNNDINNIEDKLNNYSNNNLIKSNSLVRIETKSEFNDSIASPQITRTNTAEDASNYKKLFRLEENASAKQPLKLPSIVNKYSLSKTSNKSNKKDENPEFNHPDDLLKWSQALDFDNYMLGWHSLATSMPSDASYNRMYEPALNQSISEGKKYF